MRYTILAVVAVALALAACSSGDSKPKATPTPDAASLLQQGLDAHVAGDLDTAIAAYNAVLASEPQNKYAQFNLGLIDQSRGNLDSAENHYRLAISADPEYVPALFNLATVRTALAYPLDAISLYRRAIAVQENYAGAHLNLGLLLRQIGLTDESDAEIAQAVELDPSIGVNNTGTPVASETDADTETP
jgi:tetratricopeptide (TPR) repeat protein